MTRGGVRRNDLDLTLQGTVEKEEVGSTGRRLRKASQHKMDYSLMFGADEDKRDCRTSRHKAQEEEEIEGWVKAIVEMQQKRLVWSFVSCTLPPSFFYFYGNVCVALM